MARALKANDVLELSKLYQAEFNKPELHDRVLVFDVMRDGWERSAVLISSLRNETVETQQESQTSEEAEKSEDQNLASFVLDVKQNEAKNIDSDELTEGVLVDNEEPRQNIVETESLGDRESQTSEEEMPEDKDLASFVLDVKQNEAKCTDSHELTEAEGVLVHNEKPQQGIVENNSEIVSDTGSLPDTTGCKEDNANDQAVDKIDSTTSIVSNPETARNKVSILRQHRFFVHSSWLALQSSYFRSLFFSGMKESNFKEVHVKISECEEKAHLQLFEAMYKPDILDEVGVDELLAVLQLAHKYDVRFVFRKCKYVLQATEMSLQICEKIMRFIKIEHTLTDVEDLAATLQTFLAKTFSPLDKTWQTKSFENLSEQSVRYLLSSDRLRTQSENTVFHALMHWVECNDLCSSSSCSNTPLLSVIRFEVMPIDYLYNVVQYHPIATKMAEFSGLYLKGVTYHALTREMKERLTVKPFSRDPIQKEIVQYTWVIPGDDVEEFVSSGKILKSGVFWCCGYSMQLCLEEEEKTEKTQYYRSGFYRATLGLQIKELRNESVIAAKWTWTSKTIFPADIVNQQIRLSRNSLHKHIFSVDIPTALVPVQFEWESDVPKMQAATQVESVFTAKAPSGGFNFGSSSPSFIQCTATRIATPISTPRITSQSSDMQSSSFSLVTSPISTTQVVNLGQSVAGFKSPQLPSSTPEPVEILEPETLQSLSIEVKISLYSLV